MKFDPKDFGIEIKLSDDKDFLKVKETLTRIGVGNSKQHILWQSCHILHKQGKYRLVHFKEMFALDGRDNDINENDIARRNTIANLLEQWGLVTLAEPDKSKDLTVPVRELKILSFSEKPNWTLQPKYAIGKRKALAA